MRVHDQCEQVTGSLRLKSTEDGCESTIGNTMRMTPALMFLLADGMSAFIESDDWHSKGVVFGSVPHSRR